ncbi:MAG: hypothetical protein ACT4QC_13475 [Planctomycetaceae bacterium]
MIRSRVPSLAAFALAAFGCSSWSFAADTFGLSGRQAVHTNDSRQQVAEEKTAFFGLLKPLFGGTCGYGNCGVGGCNSGYRGYSACAPTGNACYAQPLYQPCAPAYGAPAYGGYYGRPVAPAPVYRTPAYGSPYYYGGAYGATGTVVPYVAGAGGNFNSPFYP